jgi:stage V sporulation protein R
LVHQFNGPELTIDYARATLTNLHRLWGRPVHIQTVLERHLAILSFDGHEHQTVKTDKVVAADPAEQED